MGRILFIRVSAETYSEEDVLRAWPNLCRYAFGEEYCQGREKLLVPRKHGVLELLQSLFDKNNFDLLEPAAREVLAPGLTLAEQSVVSLERALGDRDAQAAYKLTNDIEDILDEMQKNIVLSGVGK